MGRTTERALSAIAAGGESEFIVAHTVSRVKNGSPDVFAANPPPESAFEVVRVQDNNWNDEYISWEVGAFMIHAKWIIGRTFGLIRSAVIQVNTSEQSLQSLVVFVYPVVAVRPVWQLDREQILL